MRYTQKVLISAVVGSGPKPVTNTMQLVSASVTQLGRRGCPHLKQETAFPMSACRKKGQGSPGPGTDGTYPHQKFTKISLKPFCPSWGSHKPPWCYTITPPNSLLCRWWYMLNWRSNKFPPRLGFCFKPPALMCLAEMSCIHTPAQQPRVGFYWLPLSRQRFAGRSATRACRRKLQSLSEGNRPSISPR